MINTYLLSLQSQIDLPETDPPYLGTIAGIGLLFILLGILIGYLIIRSKESKAGSKRGLSGASSNDYIKKETLRAIYELTTTLNATLNYQRVLESALDVSIKTLMKSIDKRTSLVCAVMLFDQDRLVVRSARRFTHADMRVVLPGNEGLLGRTIDRGEPRMSTDIKNDPELKRLVALRACNSAYCIPLRSGLDIYGVLLYAHDDPHFFDSTSREMLDIVAGQAMVAFQNARLYQDLEQEKERLVETEEEARKKLARNLHDGPTQSVSAIAMRVNFARRLLERDPKQANEELYKIEELARRTTKEIRHMLFTLRPLVLETQGLTAALNTIAEKMKETYSQNMTIEVEESVTEELEIGKQGVIFYIVEEAANNVRKHADAENLNVRLRRKHQDIALLEIIDDGIGFDVDEVTSSYDSRGSLGMINLRERTELINGYFQLRSEPGKGTQIRVWIPLTEEAEERLRQGA